MKTNWLFPHRYRLIGWLIFVPSAILGLATLYAGLAIPYLKISVQDTINILGENNYTDELAGVGVIIGLLLVAFSREKVEDEMISKMRLEALQWSICANYVILIIAILMVYEGAFLYVMIYNMFTILLVFIVRFRWLIYQNNHRLAV